jgi:hypothetical protein
LSFISEKLLIFATNLRKKTEMTKLSDKFDRLFSGKVQHFSSDEIKPKTKTKIFYALRPYGLTKSTFYLRLFDKGFSPWEIYGIRHIKNTFIDAHRTELRRANGGSIQFRDNNGDFFRLLRNAELITVFKDYMLELGMSPNTTTARFSIDNWKPWEKRGLKDIITRFLERYDEDEY